MTSTVNARYIDFHSHFYDPAWFSSPTTMGQGILARAWPLLTDIEAQLAAMDSAEYRCEGAERAFSSSR